MTEVVSEVAAEIDKGQSLYEQDILLWVEDTVTKLKAGDFASVDIVNLIEEVESLGISQKHQLYSRLLVLLEHLLKRLYVPLSDDYRGWERTIRNQRNALEYLIKQAPSLKTRWDDSFTEAWQVALRTVRKECRQVNFPDRWSYPADIETMLDRDFWEEDQTSIK